MNTSPHLPRVTTADVERKSRSPVDRQTILEASEIVDAVRIRGEAAVRDYATRFDERLAKDSILLGPDDMRAALDTLDPMDCTALERAADRIETFAQAQRNAISEMTMAIQGGETGHTIEPVESAGCYAPAGRYPLPSSVLMTAVTARTAGCSRVVVASPGAHTVALAAASIAGADQFLAVGGAHAIAALAYGFKGCKRCDVIVGPGNRWVTAAKQVVSGIAGIDMLAGPSELLVLADSTGDPELIAADLLAQAEHDTDAIPMFVTTSSALADDVDREIEQQLNRLLTREVATQALKNGFVCVNADMKSCIELVNRIAPEHLEILTEDPQGIAYHIRNAGALFVGDLSAEVFGDYGAGPNHTLPTGGTARFQAGLSVVHFLRLRTWMRLDSTILAADLIADTQRIAALERLSGHGKSAQRRAHRT